jgi:hypothetical protein
MKTRIATALLLAASAAAMPVAHAANVGYYELCDGAGRAVQATAISAAGHTPVNITVPDAASLAGLKALFVTNCSNDVYAAEYTANLGAIANAVNAGMALVFHDRRVTGASGVLPGAAGITFVGDVYGAEIDFPAGSPLLTGPGGTLNNTSLDGGNSSTHGYIEAATLPAGSTALAYEASTTRLATASYRYGAGKVVYSTIPLDYYLAGNGPAATAANMRDIYAPNVIAWAAPSFTSCAAEGYTGSKLTLCQKVCESNYSGSTLNALIRMYVAAYREQPACVR